MDEKQLEMKKTPLSPAIRKKHYRIMAELSMESFGYTPSAWHKNGVYSVFYETWKYPEINYGARDSKFFNSLSKEGISLREVQCFVFLFAIKFTQ